MWQISCESEDQPIFSKKCATIFCIKPKLKPHIVTLLLAKGPRSMFGVVLDLVFAFNVVSILYLVLLVMLHVFMVLY